MSAPPAPQIFQPHAQEWLPLMFKYAYYWPAESRMMAGGYAQTSSRYQAVGRLGRASPGHL